MPYLSILSVNIWDQNYKNDGEINKDEAHMIRAGWLKWRKMSRIMRL